jgi:L-threonylcarbamoyladenylate synthase
VDLLSLQAPLRTDGFAAVEVLSPTGDLREAAANLFAALRRLDRLGLDLILARPVPDRGLGRAILDRLRKANAIPSAVSSQLPNGRSSYDARNESRR